MYSSAALTTEHALQELASVPNRRDIKSILDRLALSADTKSVLLRIADITVQIGNVAVAIGRKIIAVAVGLVRTFPNIVFGVVVAIIVSMLISSVPIVSVSLATTFGPLLIAVGLSRGALAELEDGQLADRVREFITVVETALSA